MKSIKQGYHNLMMKYSSEYSKEHYLDFCTKFRINYEYKGDYTCLLLSPTEYGFKIYLDSGFKGESITIALTLAPFGYKEGFSVEMVDLSICYNQTLVYSDIVLTTYTSVSSSDQLDELIDSIYLEYLILRKTNPEIFNKHSKKSLYWLC